MDPDAKEPIINQCPDCSRAIDVTAHGPFSKVVCPLCGSSVRVRTMMGKYEIVGVLGAGGMSQVFRAIDVHLQREVALKILHQSLTSDSALTAMFEREAKLTASILHPNVVKVYTVGQDQGYFFIAMELVDATSLEEMIATRGAIPESEVLRVAHDVTNGLRAAREEGLIHRDIKPGNMLVTEEGVSKLVDFGLAVQQGGEDLSEDLWATPFYVPPEKLDGKTDTYLGDIYSLGATLYHALAGRPPFEANTSSLDELKVIKQAPVSLRADAPGTTKPTLKLIESMMAYKPQDRPQDYNEILERIEEIEKTQFGIRRSDAIHPTRVKWIVVGTFSALTAVVAGIYIQLQKQPQATGDGPLGIGSGERVIGASDDANARHFLEGRELLAQGKFRRAEEIFDGLANETGLAPTTRMWTNYFHGLVRLFLGKEEEARRSFGMIEAVSAGEGTADPILLEISRRLSQPLPLLPEDAKFPSTGPGAAGTLAAGLKNWQQGQFDSGAELLRSFLESDTHVGYEWLAALKEEAKSFLHDHEAVKSAPNPSRKGGADLADQKEQLETVLAAAKTEGAFPALVQSRIDRIDAIKTLVADEEWQQLEAVAGDDDADMGATVSSGPDGGPTAAEQAERDKLREILPSLSQYGETLLFSGAIARLQAETFETPRGISWRDDLVEGYMKAGDFVPMLAEKLDAGTYSGTVRRRVGVPLDAKITSADSSIFIVDLGFGPNEVETELFAPDWLVEAAVELLEAPDPGNLDQWQMVVFFSLATGQAVEADRIAGTLGGIDPGFDRLWSNLQALRGNAAAPDSAGVVDGPN